MNKSKYGNPIEINKYQNQLDELDNKSGNCNIYNLPFKMVYHYYQQLFKSRRNKYKNNNAWQRDWFVYMVCFWSYVKGQE